MDATVSLFLKKSDYDKQVQVMKPHAKTRAIVSNNTIGLRIGLATILAIVLVALITNIGPAKAAQFPYCDDVPVEYEIVRDFNWAEKKTWQRGFELVRLSKAHQHRVVQHEGSPVIRRYCMARAHLSNGRHHSIYYIVDNIGGFVGKNWNVKHCVIGLDPWRNHDGNCRALR